MTSDLPPSLSFDTLRARGIKAAQDASGHIWTDYNLHDPGVTLLEQTGFALTEVAYQGDHQVRDLLTDANGVTDFEHLALFDAGRVLPGRAVTYSDIAGCLSDVDGVERVFVRHGTAHGLINLMVVPSDNLGVDPATHVDLVDRVKSVFDDNRLLCTDIEWIKIADCRPIHVHGNIHLTTYADPDSVTAEVMYLVRHLLRGVQPVITDKTTGASRDETFDDPSVLWPDLIGDTHINAQLNAMLAAIRDIPGVAQVGGFDIIDVTQNTSVEGSKLAPNTYYSPAPVTEQSLAGLCLLRDDSPIGLHPNVIVEELGRLEAAEIAAKSNRKDKADWNVLGTGHHRTMVRAEVDAMLPALYKYKPPRDISDQRGRHKSRDQLATYRGVANTHVTDVAAPLHILPQTFCAATPVDFRDPAQIRRRIEMLDYLIALQGEEMPATNAAAMHKYRGPQAQAQWQINWREAYLAALPDYNRLQGTNDPLHGFPGRLAHLADLQLQSKDTAIETVLVRPSQDALPADPRIDPLMLILPTRPLDVFITPSDDVPMLDAEAIAAICPWVVDGATTPELFRRAAQADAYTIFRNHKSDLELQFDPGPRANRYACISNRSRNVLEVWGNRIRKTFQMLNQSAEQLLVIEDIKLRKTALDFAPSVAHAFIPGWTLRTADPAYRQYVSELVERLAPAHVHVRLHWLEPGQMSDIQPKLTAWQNGTKDSAGDLRATMVRCGVAL